MEPSLWRTCAAMGAVEHCPPLRPAIESPPALVKA